MTTLSTVPPPVAASPRTTWPTDIVVLAVVTATLWAVTFAWHAFGIADALEPPIKSERDAWVFALSGGALLYLLVNGIVGSWGVFLGIPTTLLIAHLALRRFPRQRRWILAGVATAVIFVGVPMVLNHREAQRLAPLFQADDPPAPIDLAGRTVELPTTPPVHNADAFQVSCGEACQFLLLRAHARSVIVSMSDPKGGAATGPRAQSFRAGPRGAGCAGMYEGELCPHPTDEAPPRDRLVVTVADVAIPAGSPAGTSARRLSVRDTAKGHAAPATFTRFVFPYYPALLNIRWDSHGFSLPRRAAEPLFAHRVDDRLYRKAFVYAKK